MNGVNPSVGRFGHFCKIRMAQVRMFAIPASVVRWRQFFPRRGAVSFLAAGEQFGEYRTFAAGDVFRYRRQRRRQHDFGLEVELSCKRLPVETACFLTKWKTTKRRISAAVVVLRHIRANLSRRRQKRFHVQTAATEHFALFDVGDEHRIGCRNHVDMTDDQNVKNHEVFAVGKQNDPRKGRLCVIFIRPRHAEGSACCPDEVHAAFNFPHVASFGEKF